MIPHNELRIGNFILIDNVLHQICLINNDSGFADASFIGYQSEGNTHNVSCASTRVKPVPLTDEVLQRSGFTYHDYFKFWQKVEHVSGKRSEMDIDRDYSLIDFMRRPVVKSIVSLHQLQNIYFSLKGKEIEFKEI